MSDIEKVKKLREATGAGCVVESLGVGGECRGAGEGEAARGGGAVESLGVGE